MILEIRTYRLVSGAGEEFLRLMREESVPLLERAGIQVVDCGVSLAAEEGHRDAYLIRAFPSLDALHEQEQAFYAGDAWRKGPREAIVSRIASYHSVVLEVPEAAIEALKRRRSR